MQDPRRLTERLFEAAILIALSAFLIRLAALYIAEVWPILLIVTVIALAAVIGWRVYRWRKNRDL